MESPAPPPQPRELPDPHLGLAPLQEAGRRARADIAVLRVVLRFNPARPWRSRRLELVAKAWVFLGAHWRLVRDLWQRRGCDLVLVREFLTQLLCIVWPLIWPLRKRVYFLVNHNLQEAHRRLPERVMLRFLHRTGCRFACLETAAGWREIAIEPRPEHVFVVPHPMGRLPPPRPARTGLPVVGVIGMMRPEKDSEAVLEELLRLRAQGRLEASLLLGCPDAGARETWRERGFEVIDTLALDDYLGALDRCDVVVLNYRRERYFYRASGVAADAITRGAAVVCPDFPLMRHQLTVPAKVGATFDGLAGLEAALAEALALCPDLEGGRTAHARERTALALARVLDAYVAEHLAGGARWSRNA